MMMQCTSSGCSDAIPLEQADQERLFHTTLHLGLGLIPATHRSVVSHTTNLGGVGEQTLRYAGHLGLASPEIIFLSLGEALCTQILPLDNRKRIHVGPDNIYIRPSAEGKHYPDRNKSMLLKTPAPASHVPSRMTWTREVSVWTGARCIPFHRSRPC